MTRRPTRIGAAAVLFIVASGLTGCKQKDAAKCQEGQDGVRKSLAAGEDTLLNQWRTYAYKYCEDQATLAALDREITDTRAAKAKAEAEKAQQQQQTDQLLSAFLGWVGGNRNAPERAAAQVSCDGGEEEKSQERWCVRTRVAGTQQLNVRYWEKESVAAKFDVVIPLPITCDKLGGARVIRSWTVPGQQVKRYHCEITAGAAVGMQAMVSEANNATLHVFSPQYLEKDGALKNKLATEGM
jgi:hypothetical protein